MMPTKARMVNTGTGAKCSFHCSFSLCTGHDVSSDCQCSKLLTCHAVAVTGCCFIADMWDGDVVQFIMGCVLL